MKIKVLVVEDKESLNNSIVSMLKKERYTAFGETDIEGAKQRFLAEKPHIILLDIMLPNGNGYNLIPFFRKHYNSRILMMTALDDEQSKISSYENGADDYITKPFDLYELIYKLGAIRGRIISEIKEYHIGDITFYVDTNRLTCKEKNFNIQPSQIKLLRWLCEKHDENICLDKTEFSVFFREELNENCRMQTLVARLRRNLLDIGSEEVTIETIYNKGYQLVVSPRQKQ